MKANNNLFNIVFENENNEVSAELLIGCLMHTSAIINSLNRSMGEEKQLEIKIKALEKGSFQVNIELIETFIKSIFSSSSVSYASDLISLLKDLYALVKFLRGKRPQEIKHGETTTTIINHYGETTIVNNNTYHVYNSNSEVRNHITQQFNQMNQCSDITGFRFEHGGEQVRATQEEFADMGTEIPYALSEDEIAPLVKIEEGARLLIIRPSFDPKLAWDFVYNGMKISARVKDETIWKAINEGETFSKGSQMLADIEITQRYNPELGVHMIDKDSYKVLRFKAHLPTHRQGTLF